MNILLLIFKNIIYIITGIILCISLEELRNNILSKHFIHSKCFHIADYISKYFNYVIIIIFIHIIIKAEYFNTYNILYIKYDQYLIAGIIIGFIIYLIYGFIVIEYSVDLLNKIMKKYHKTLDEIDNPSLSINEKIKIIESSNNKYKNKLIILGKMILLIENSVIIIILSMIFGALSYFIFKMIL